jgi:cellulose synthase/poly-beta-1,6-N-acetylglucosamine synthase-like glycosyltransferase
MMKFKKKVESGSEVCIPVWVSIMGLTSWFSKIKYPVLIYAGGLYCFVKVKLTTYKTSGCFMKPEGSLRGLK